MPPWPPHCKHSSRALEAPNVVICRPIRQRHEHDGGSVGRVQVASPDGTIVTLVRKRLAQRRLRAAERAVRRAGRVAPVGDEGRVRVLGVADRAAGRAGWGWVDGCAGRGGGGQGDVVEEELGAVEVGAVAGEGKGQEGGGVWRGEDYVVLVVLVCGVAADACGVYDLVA